MQQMCILNDLLSIKVKAVHTDDAATNIESWEGRVTGMTAAHHSSVVAGYKTQSEEIRVWSD